VAVGGLLVRRTLVEFSTASEVGATAESRVTEPRGICRCTVADLSDLSSTRAASLAVNRAALCTIRHFCFGRQLGKQNNNLASGTKKFPKTPSLRARNRRCHDKHRLRPERLQSLCTMFSTSENTQQQQFRHTACSNNRLIQGALSLEFITQLSDILWW
jgi:hypothetical protein